MVKIKMKDTNNSDRTAWQIGFIADGFVWKPN